MRQAAWSNPTAGLADGEADAALVRLPFPGQDTLRVEVLFTEPRWVALPTAHRLATRDEIPSGTCGTSHSWQPTRSRLVAGLLAGHRRTRRPPVRIGAVTDQPDDWLSAIANGYGIAFAPSPPPASTHARASPTGPSPTSAPARSASHGYLPPTATPLFKTSSTAA
ncbi:LysR substrate-binding domain-containing protein [Micromonospora sp. M12]